MKSLSTNPVNLAVRLLLELIALACYAVWGWHRGTGIMAYLLAVGLPLIVVVVWGTFRVDNDPKKAPVKVPGIVRLIIELLVFGLAIAALFDMGMQQRAWVMLIVTVVHYIVSYDRIKWLIRQ